MLKSLSSLFGDKNSRYLKHIQPLVDAINAHEAGVAAKSDTDLAATTDALKKRFQQGETLDDLLPEAFAAVREAAKRALGLRPFDVQLIGGIILHQGRIAEMKTGEGKTLAATLPAYLNALTGQAVHVVTVNDYLAKRDADWMGKVFTQLGMRTAAITNDLAPPQRKEAYAADVVYATNNELGFDYLRDNMMYEPENLVQRPAYFAIVDEVDSILIDEARTPLVISGPMDDVTDLYVSINDFMPQFVEGEDYEKEEKHRSVTLTDAGTDKAEKLLHESGLLGDGDSLYDVQHVRLVHHINNALRAHTMFNPDVDYIIHEGGVVLIDEFTGRMTPGRRLSDGLHQALEAKEGVDIRQENQTLASITFQNYFRLYEKLAGMTGTAETEEEEFGMIYNLPVVVVPTHVDIAREDEDDIIYRSRIEKLKAIVKDIQDCFKRGQPVLVGTTSIEKSEELSELLKQAKVPHKVLNARYHEQEAEIVSQAGRLGAVTIATNMAGRGTDIKLGGNLELLLENAQTPAEQQKIRAQYEEEKAAVMDAGGLRVLGTERHESRRIDNQLRGRSGRQGDVGSSVFYISLQDDLMRIFASNLEGLMGRLNMPEDEAIRHPWISKSLETAQKKIEGMHFDARKQVLKFDDVLNEQRKVIYAQRKELLLADTVSEDVADYRADVIDQFVDAQLPPGTLPEQWNIKGLTEQVLMFFHARPPLQEWAATDDQDTIAKKLLQHVDDLWAQKVERFGKDITQRLEKLLLLQVVDRQWRAHLQELDYLRKGIVWRGYAQKDPVNEYKREAFELFERMLMTIRHEVVTLLMRVEIHEEDLVEMKSMAQEQVAKAEVVHQNEGQSLIKKENPEALEDLMQNVPRNAPCPCGSGKKFKHCHGRVDSKAA